MCDIPSPKQKIIANILIVRVIEFFTCKILDDNYKVIITTKNKKKRESWDDDGCKEER